MKYFDLYLFRLMVVLCFVSMFLVDDKTYITMASIGAWLFYIADTLHKKQLDIEKKIDDLNKD